MHWLVRDVDLRIVAPVSYGDRLRVRTEVTGLRHVWARRHAELRRLAAGDGRHGETAANGGDGEAAELVAVVETDWVLRGRDGRPVGLPPEIATLLTGSQNFARRRLDVDATPGSAARMSARVRPSDVDPMGHLNNAAYLDLVDEATANVTASTGSVAWNAYR